MEKELQDKVIQAYRTYLLEEGKPPASVFKFCRELGIAEGDFFKAFASFSAVEGRLWEGLVNETRAVLAKDESLAEAGARARLLSFHFTFLEIARENRSLLLMRFPRYEPLKCSAGLGRLKERFQEFAKEVLKAGKQSGEFPDRSQTDSLLRKLMETHFRLVIDFYLKDESDGFTRTDAFVEKTVTLFFELAGARVVESTFDLVRFLAGRAR